MEVWFQIEGHPVSLARVDANSYVDDLKEHIVRHKASHICSGLDALSIDVSHNGVSLEPHVRMMDRFPNGVLPHEPLQVRLPSRVHVEVSSPFVHSAQPQSSTHASAAHSNGRAEAEPLHINGAANRSVPAFMQDQSNAPAFMREQQAGGFGGGNMQQASLPAFLATTSADGGPLPPAFQRHVMPRQPPPASAVGSTSPNGQSVVDPVSHAGGPTVIDKHIGEWRCCKQEGRWDWFDKRDYDRGQKFGSFVLGQEGGAKFTFRIQCAPGKYKVYMWSPHHETHSNHVVGWVRDSSQAEWHMLPNPVNQTIKSEDWIHLGDHTTTSGSCEVQFRTTEENSNIAVNAIRLAAYDL